MKAPGQERFYFQEVHGRHWRGLILIASIISVAAIVCVKLLRSGSDRNTSVSQRTAAILMQEAISAIQAHCDSVGIPIDIANDPNRTGIIGSEISPIATTLGNLEAKRTSTNPAFARVIVHLLQQAGVNPGDSIAIGCSASFPALMIATLAAAKALSVYPITILSLGSSSYGATNPDFNLLHIFQVLYQKKIFPIAPRAISLGGDRDVGDDFDPAIRSNLIEQIEQSGIELLYEPNLEKNVARRMNIYLGPGGSHRIAAFVNIGGNYANIGTSELVLQLKPGLNRPKVLPAKEERGVLFEMASKGIPIIHLLHIKGLAFNYGLPWDPVPLPDLTRRPLGEIIDRQMNFVSIAAIDLMAISGLTIYGTIKQRQLRRR
ncbi:MAG: poly-gamma-glutamate system protein [candidate division KSB1 bacterium]|nr:poly-gamma-glutamate system protein [candidate division KSB1 bacterium]MDZ7336397.1 poly-gamma-glutamate system protein [candidate division KSB1 bacterium]MDZ7358490.1 poly-gamma-glutamate system protein [candidate division KSB1 bacterium]MDZ7375737.1 poly-gamma-glutamate system protein [candidate division KSB1 bacterium]MDZ7401470.1 poly-gamma-glutamate system protein [candidate division KSB1 bacterium]